MKPSKALTQKDLANGLEIIARAHVDHWIENNMATYDMKDQIPSLIRLFEDLLRRDIELFALTGRYPKYAK